jgi:hypothetical protein
MWCVLWSLPISIISSHNVAHGRGHLACSKVIWFFTSCAICYMNKQLPLKDRIDETRASPDQTLSWTVGGLVLQPFLINLCEHSYFHNDCFWVKVA